MARITADEFVEKHARRLKGATEDIIRGVDRVTTAPGELAAKKKEKMRAGINAAIDSGRWENAVKKVTLSDWQTSMKNKGVGRIAAGVDGAANKIRDFANQILPHIDSVKAGISTMPDLTLEDNIARSAAFQRGMAKFKKK